MGETSQLGSKSIPAPAIISNPISETEFGGTGAATQEVITEVDLSSLPGYHEGLLQIDVHTRNGSGGTPTSPGAAVALGVNYGFTTRRLSNKADAPSALAGAASVDVTLPDTNASESEQASGTVTFTGVPLDTETVTVNGQAYTFKNTPASAYDVAIGVDEHAAAIALAAAINADADLAHLYFTGTVEHPTVTAEVTAFGVVTVTAKDAGTGGNSLTLAEASTVATVSGAKLAGGLASGDTVTQSAAFIHQGRYLYLWVSYDAMAANALIDLDVYVVRL